MVPCKSTVKEVSLNGHTIGFLRQIKDRTTRNVSIIGSRSERDKLSEPKFLSNKTLFSISVVGSMKAALEMMIDGVRIGDEL